MFATLVSSASPPLAHLYMTLRFLPASCVIMLMLAACGSAPEPPAATAPVGGSVARPAVVIAPAHASASASVNGTLTSEVYVWQRAWMPGNLTALSDSRTIFSELRVLAAQQQPGEGWVDARIDLDGLKQDGREVRPVIRLDGRLPTLDANVIATRAHDLVTAWRTAGVQVDGVEIDFDCASARLADYAKVLGVVKSKLPGEAKLSITVLPAWIGAPGLGDVLAQADEAVLQVHAVSDPRHGLFDSKQAQQWIAAFAKQTSKPFLVALPAYGSALVLDANGKTIGVESESALPEPGERLELFSDPHAVADLLQAIRKAPPGNLRGFVWFRLPLPGDRRAWPLTTISAVIAGQPLHTAWTPNIDDAGNGAFDVTVHNSGNLEAVLPASVDVGGVGCSDADALPGYRMEHAAGALRFVRDSNATLPATQTRSLGWVRCAHLVPGDLHVRA
jgi:hypothetical protein